MSGSRWSAIDHLFNAHLIAPDALLDQVIANGLAAGLPAHQVSANQAAFLGLLCRIQGARRVLEIGTLFAYSTIWFARSIPSDGQVVTLESNPGCVKIARKNLELAGVDDMVEIMEGPALESLKALAARPVAPFDFVFIDADKRNNPSYLQSIMGGLVRPGTLIVADNVVRGGRILDEAEDDPDSAGVRDFAALVGADPRLSATAIQTVGEKGYDGFMLIRVDSEGVR